MVDSFKNMIDSFESVRLIQTIGRLIKDFINMQVLTYDQLFQEYDWLIQIVRLIQTIGRLIKDFIRMHIET